MAWSRLLVVSVLALLGTLATHVAPAAAQKKISVLTWNIPVYFRGQNLVLPAPLQLGADR